MMKKLLLSIVVAATSITASAQLTADGVIGLCPTLPSVADMKNHTEAFYDFEKNIKAAIDKAEENMEKIPRTSVTPMPAADRQAAIANAQQMAAKLKKMTPEQLKAFALQQANKKTSMNVAGMTLDDLEALTSVPDDQQRINIAKQMGLTVSPEQAAKIQAQVKKDAAKGKKVGNFNDASMDMVKSQQHVIELEQSVEATIEEGKALWASKYQQRLDQLAKKREEVGWDDLGIDQNTNNQALALEAQMRNLKDDFYDKYIPKYRDAVLALMEYVKTTHLMYIRKYQQAAEAMGQPGYEILDYNTGCSYLEKAKKLLYFDDVFE